MTVYIIRNQINGKIYIGQTRKSVYQRWRGHVKASKSKTLACSRMWIARAIAKYGAENFTIEPLGVYEDLKSMNRAEMDFIAQYRSTDPDIGYNIALGGDGHTMGPEERKKISERNKRLFQGENNPFFGKTHSDEFKARMSAIQSGRKDSPDLIARRLETLRKSGKAIGPLHHHYGQSPSEETKKKLSAAFTGERNHQFGKRGPLAPNFGRRKKIANIAELAERFNSGESAHHISLTIEENYMTLKRRLYESGLCPTIRLTPPQMKHVTLRPE